jgi:transcriptional regulator with GAF, ATPase, and Fis domain
MSPHEWSAYVRELILWEQNRRSKANSGGTNMAWGNAVLSENQNDVDAYLTGRGDEADRSTRATAESTSSPLFSTVTSRGRHAMNSKGVNDGFEDIVGASGALREVLDLVRAVAPTNSTALIEGETGTGKELIARAIHELSTRRDRPFVKLNCAAIPLGLLESELFGHERGAFTGAVVRKMGRFEAANRGTLFLDEIGDIPRELQPKLLRVLQEGEFERLGSTQTLRVDVRLVAATNRNLEEMIARNEFRSDLYFRLNVFPIVLPPLRERQEDIPALVVHFVEVFSRRTGKQIHDIPAETMNAFKPYSWPGNIRELQNMVERAVILANDGVLPKPLTPSARLPITKVAAKAGPVTLEDRLRAFIVQTLQECGWSIGGREGAAARLGLRRSTLYYRMNKLGIKRPSPGGNVGESMGASAQSEQPEPSDFSRPSF